MVELFYREHSSNRSSPKTEGDKAQCIPATHMLKMPRSSVVLFGLVFYHLPLS